MTGRAKGRLALALLALVVTGFATALAFNDRARVRFWMWRMHSSDRKVARHAREKLLEIGRPANEACYAEVVAEEVAENTGGFDRSLVEAFVGSVVDIRANLTDYRVVDRFLSPFEPGRIVAASSDPADKREVPPTGRDLVVLGDLGTLGTMGYVELDVVPLDDREASVLEAVRLRGVGRAR